MWSKEVWADTVLGFVTGGTTAQKIGAVGVAVLGSAIWEAYTSLAVAVLSLFILLDVVFGVGRAVHEGGIQAFQEDRFWRAGIKAGAAFGVVAMAVGMDLLITRSESLPPDWSPFLASGVSVLCVGYSASVAKNAIYFFPDLDFIFEKFQARQAPKTKPAHDRRSDDGAGRGAGAPSSPEGDLPPVEEADEP